MSILNTNIEKTPTFFFLLCLHDEKKMTQNNFYNLNDWLIPHFVLWMFLHCSITGSLLIILKKNYNYHVINL